MKKVLLVLSLALLSIGGWSPGADFNGDGTGDIAIFRDGSGLWAVRSVSRFYFGTTGDLPKPSDWEGNGTDLPAIFRGSSGLWAIRGFSRVYFGAAGDKAKPGDYNGDGTEDIGIFRASSGLWAARSITRVYFGASGDRAIAPDLANGASGGGGRLLKTGQFTELSSGDDGTYKAGIAFSYQTDDPAGNGEIVTIDNVTGLMWASDSNEAGCFNGQTATWSEAITYCNDLTFAGYSDWRLPNVRELKSLVDYGATTPAINEVYFPNMPGTIVFWTSTTHVTYSDVAWAIRFSYGIAVDYLKFKSFYLRSVRGGL